MTKTVDLLHRIPKPVKVKNRISRQMRELRLLRQLLKLARSREEHLGIIQQAEKNAGGEA